MNKKMTMKDRTMAKRRRQWKKLLSMYPSPSPPKHCSVMARPNYSKWILATSTPTVLVPQAPTMSNTQSPEVYRFQASPWTAISLQCRRKHRTKTETNSKVACSTTQATQGTQKSLTRRNWLRTSRAAPTRAKAKTEKTTTAATPMTRWRWNNNKGGEPKL